MSKSRFKNFSILGILGLMSITFSTQTFSEEDSSSSSSWGSGIRRGAQAAFGAVGAGEVSNDQLNCCLANVVDRQTRQFVVAYGPKGLGKYLGTLLTANFLKPIFIPDEKIRTAAEKLTNFNNLLNHSIQDISSDLEARLPTRTSQECYRYVLRGEFVDDLVYKYYFARILGSYVGGLVQDSDFAGRLDLTRLPIQLAGMQSIGNHMDFGHEGRAIYESFTRWQDQRILFCRIGWFFEGESSPYLKYLAQAPILYCRITGIEGSARKIQEDFGIVINRGAAAQNLATTAATQGLSLQTVVSSLRFAKATCTAKQSLEAAPAHIAELATRVERYVVNPPCWVGVS
ncbi:hypothetical protein [Candidatus Finniella inopinata]|uniref:Uncharacterized protein n=1 Tax=Candidatus Finniella inopinata TaxID=1696036 RepID=A0A4Q7DLP6_9PROT|nr:hypothetical protein [Candidatus Finniella inopinata]RZI45666.1 hypothetical protein EQU50_06075 [Candidatus Finniella inopinata]